MLDTPRHPAATAAAARAGARAPRPLRAAPGRVWVGWLRMALLLAALTAGAGACGYHVDVPALPGGAHSLALQRIANFTDTGELDVRLRTQLEQRLAQQAHVQVNSPEHSALALDVVLDSFRVDRVLDPAITTDRSIVYSLSGRISLTELRNGRKLLDNEAVTVQVQRLYDPSVRETPAIRDEGIHDVLAMFADEVERRLFRTF
jgi:hypothetical protein